MQRISRSSNPEPIQACAFNKILLVEHQKKHRTMMGKMIEYLGFIPIMANNAADAISFFQQHRGQILMTILDLAMPDMKSMQTFRSMRHIDPQAKIILSSAYCDNEMIEAMKKLDVTGFIPKPLQFEFQGIEIFLSMLYALVR